MTDERRDQESKNRKYFEIQRCACPWSYSGKRPDVSRQIIVSDIALLRANGLTILSTNKGYIIPKQSACQRVFKVIHTDDQVGEELSLIVDNGGVVKDVFVYHKVYGVIRADMNIRTRRNVKKFLEGLSSGSSSLLKNVTGGYHYHTIEAESEEILDDIQNELAEKGFLAKLQDYEPVDFWGEEESNTNV